MTPRYGIMPALIVLFLLSAILPARAGTLFADGVEVDGPAIPGTGADMAAAPAHDPLPLLFDDMDQYDQIAMEPYRETYDDLPTEEKIRLYSAQFESLNNRKPNFDPAIVAAIGEGESDAGGGGDAGEEWADGDGEDIDLLAEDGEGGPYDPLPMFFEELDVYGQIALEPYREAYDAMPVPEKAAVYARQFEFMNNREPNFNPAVRNAVRRSALAKQSAYEAKRFLYYKPATPKRPLPTAAERAGEVLKGLPGPWESNPGAAEEPEGAPRRGYRSDSRRMETLREGWNAVDVLRGARDR